MIENIEEISDELKDHRILCRFDRSELIKERGVLLFLNPISDEPDPILCNPDMFQKRDDGDDEPHFLLWGRDLLEAIRAIEGLKNANQLLNNLEKQQQYIQKYLRGKLLLIRPFYKLKESGYLQRSCDKSLNNIEIFPDIKKTGRYLTVPSISEESFNKLKQNQSINLTNWNCEIFGVPHYLDLGNKLVHCSLESPNQSNTVQLKKGSELRIFFFKSEPNIKSGALIASDFDNSYRFFAGAGIHDMIENQVNDNDKDSVITLTAAEAKAESSKDDDEVGTPDQKDYTLLSSLWDYIRERQLGYSKDDLNNFHSCMKSGLLTILAGMSGTGKTRLPLEYASFFGLNEDDGTLLFLPISPSYTEPDDILGYYNPQDKMFVPSPTGLTEVLIEASKHPEKAYMVLFEEMNLSQIEHWFAPFLSIMEKDSDYWFIQLYSNKVECRNSKDFPARIKIGTNIMFVGTINIDETTTALSDRLLDRSFVIHLEKMSFSKYSNLPSTKDRKEKKAISSPEELLEALQPRCFDAIDFIAQFTPRQIEFFDRMDDLLNRTDSTRGVSFRCLKNIAIYMKGCSFSDTFTPRLAIDYAINQTIFRKIRGTAESLGNLLSESENSLIQLFNKYTDISDFRLCRKDIEDKRDQLKKYGFIR